MSARIHTFPDKAAAAEAAARFALDKLDAAVKANGRASFAVSGGSTPKIMFERMVALTSQLDWTVVDLFWVDERIVPPDHPDSNYRMTQGSLIHPLGLGESQVHRIQGEQTPSDAARLYEQEIREHFNLGPADLPKFDLIHLGMGDDAHTASLFPGEPRIDDQENIAANIFAKTKSSHRVTLLPGVLQSAKSILFLVTGADKSKAFNQVIKGDPDPKRYPAQLTANTSDWFIDKPVQP